MALSSSSTVADAVNQYKDNSAWWESETKCKALLEACTFLAGVDNKRLSDAGLSLERHDLLKLIDILSPYARAWAEQTFNTTPTARKERWFTSGRPL
jgi:hypothetical protein